MRTGRKPLQGPERVVTSLRHPHWTLANVPERIHYPGSVPCSGGIQNEI